MYQHACERGEGSWSCDRSSERPRCTSSLDGCNRTSGQVALPSFGIAHTRPERTAENKPAQKTRRRQEANQDNAPQNSRTREEHTTTAPRHAARGHGRKHARPTEAPQSKERKEIVKRANPPTQTLHAATIRVSVGLPACLSVWLSGCRLSVRLHADVSYIPPGSPSSAPPHSARHHRTAP